jgi:hypothetical protein
MKTERIIGLVAIIGVIFFSLTTHIFAQHLMEDDVWFKMKFSVQGHTIQPVEPYKNASTAYVRFSPTVTDYQHTWELWSLNPTTENWEVYSSKTQYIQGEPDGIVIGWEPSWNAGSDSFKTLVNGVMKIKRDDLVTKSAKFTSTGCWLQGTATVGVYGGCKISGTKVLSNKLPFTP